ncbi:hypothetical protein MKX08_002582 [Trichoderma sp. CBMAI-0020]|nr:hypothetical protein MKX08_002582 [Trichoderma sp. CBMAI-0020]
MLRLENRPLSWEDCTVSVVREIQKIEGASNGAIAAVDTFPLRVLRVTMFGYPPVVNPPPGAQNYPTESIEEIKNVPRVFRLAVTLEHAVSLIVSDLIRGHYDNFTLVRRVNEKAVDIKAVQSILFTLETWINSYRHIFLQFGRKYIAVRRKCDEVYLLWHEARFQEPEEPQESRKSRKSRKQLPVKEVVLEPYEMDLGVVTDMARKLTQIRKMIQTGNMSPDVWL